MPAEKLFISLYLDEDVSVKIAANLRNNGTRRLTIPSHKRLNPYTLKAIIKDAGLTDEQFKKFL